MNDMERGLIFIILVIISMSSCSTSISSVSAATTTTAGLRSDDDTKDTLNDDKQSRGLFTSQKTLRIHGGWNSFEDRYSYAQVSLIYGDEGHQCGGSLVAPDTILTASHCKGSFDKIVIGQHRANDNTDEYEVFDSINEIMHPMYDEIATRFDTMLVFMNGTSTATPVRVNNNDRLPIHGSMLTVIGYGYDAEWDLPEVLQEADVRYTRNSECDDLIDEDGTTLDGDLFGDMMCAGSDGRDACYGDSGSPLILRGEEESEDIQMGLVSWGYECAGHLPGVYSRLSYYHNFEFLEKHICMLSVQPPNYMNCGKHILSSTKSPSEKPTIAPTKKPTRYPSKSPTMEPTATLPNHGIKDATPATAADTTVESSSPTTTQLREFLEGTSSVQISKTATIIQKQGTQASNMIGLQKVSSGAFSTLFCSYVAVAMMLVTTWACFQL